MTNSVSGFSLRNRLRHGLPPFSTPWRWFRPGSLMQNSAVFQTVLRSYRHAAFQCQRAASMFHRRRATARSLWQPPTPPRVIPTASNRPTGASSARSIRVPMSLTGLASPRMTEPNKPACGTREDGRPACVQIGFRQCSWFNSENTAKPPGRQVAGAMALKAGGNRPYQVLTQSPWRPGGLAVQLDPIQSARTKRQRPDHPAAAAATAPPMSCQNWYHKSDENREFPLHQF
jgi:hypothetical protein